MNESQKHDEDLLSVFSDSDDEDNHEKEPNNVHEHILILPALHGSDQYTTNQNGSKDNVTNSHLDICNDPIHLSRLNNISNRDDIDNLIGKGTTLPIINKPWKEIQSEYRKKLSSEYMNTESTKSYKTYCALCHTQGHIYCYDCEYVYCKECWKFKHMEIHEERKLQLLPSSISHTNILSTESRHTPHNPTTSSSSNVYDVYSNSLFNASIVSDKLYTPNNSFTNIYSATIGHDSSIKKINQKVNNDEDMNNHLLRIEGCIAPTYSTYDKIRQKSTQTASTHDTYMSSKDVDIKMMTSSPSTSTASMYTLPTTSTLTSSMPSLPVSNTILIPTLSSPNISVNQYPSLVLDPLYVQPSYTIVPSLSLIPINNSNSMKSDAVIYSNDITQECNIDAAITAVTTTTSTTNSTKDMTAIMGTTSTKSLQNNSIDTTTNDTTTSPSQQPFAKYIAKKKAALRVYQPKRVIPSKQIVILYDNKKIHTHTIVHSSDTTTATTTSTTASTSYALDSSNNILEMQSLQDEKNSDINTKEIQALSSRPSTRWKPNQQSTWGHSKNRLLTPLSAATLNLRPLVSPRTSHRYTHINDNTNDLEGDTNNDMNDELMTSYSSSYLHTTKNLTISPKATTLDNHFSSSYDTHTTVPISSSSKLNTVDNVHSLTTANDCISITYSNYSLPHTYYPVTSTTPSMSTSSKLLPTSYDDKAFETEKDMFVDIEDRTNIMVTNDLKQAFPRYMRAHKDTIQSTLTSVSTSNKDIDIKLSDSIKISTLKTLGKIDTSSNTNSNNNNINEDYKDTEYLHEDLPIKPLVINNHHHNINSYHINTDDNNSKGNYDKENVDTKYTIQKEDTGSRIHSSMLSLSSLPNLQVTGTSSHITTTYTVSSGLAPSPNHSRSHSPLLRLGYKDRYLTPLSPYSSSPLQSNLNSASNLLTLSPNQPLDDLLIVNSREIFTHTQFNNQSLKADNDDIDKHENTDVENIQQDNLECDHDHDSIHTNDMIENRIEIDSSNRIDDMTTITDDVTTSDGHTLSAPNSTILKPLHMTSHIHVPEDLWYIGKTRPDICVKIKTGTSIQHDQSLESNQNSPILASAHSIIQYHKSKSILPIHMNMLSLSPIQKPHMKNMSLKKVTYVSQSPTQDMSMSRFKLSKL